MTTKTIELNEAGRKFIKALEEKHKVNILSSCTTNEEILFKALELETKSIEKIARNVSREVGNIVSWEDIKQEVFVSFYARPYSMDRFEFFYANIKRVAKDATKTHVRRYKSFSKIFIKENYKMLNGFSLHKGSFGETGVFNPLTNEYDQTTESIDYNRLERSDFMDNFRNGLSEVEKMVFKCLLVGMTKREIDEEIGSRCDRILKRVREYYMEYASM